MHVCSVVAGNTAPSASGMPFIGEGDQDVIGPVRLQVVED